MPLIQFSQKFCGKRVLVEQFYNHDLGNSHKNISRVVSSTICLIPHGLFSYRLEAWRAIPLNTTVRQIPESQFLPSNRSDLTKTNRRDFSPAQPQFPSGSKLTPFSCFSPGAFSSHLGNSQIFENFGWEEG